MGKTSDEYHLAKTRDLTKIIVVLEENSILIKRDIQQKTGIEYRKLNDAINWLLCNHLIHKSFIRNRTFFSLDNRFINLRRRNGNALL